MVVAFVGAAAIGGEHNSGGDPFGERVIMTAEHGLQIEVEETVEEGIGVARAIIHVHPHRKMGEKDGRLARVQLGQMFIEPAQGFRRDPGLLVMRPFGRVQPEELPAAIVEMVVQCGRKRRRVSGPIGVGMVIMISDHGPERAAPGAKDLFDQLEVFAVALIGQIAGVQDQLRIFPLHLSHDSLEVGAALGAHAMGVVDDQKAEGSRRRLVGGVQRARPAAERKQRARAEMSQRVAAIETGGPRRSARMGC